MIQSHLSKEVPPATPKTRPSVHPSPEKVGRKEREEREGTGEETVETVNE